MSSNSYLTDEYVGNSEYSRQPHAGGGYGGKERSEYVEEYAEDDDDVGGLFGGDEREDEDGHDYALGTGTIAAGAIHHNDKRGNVVENSAPHGDDDDANEEDGRGNQYYHGHVVAHNDDNDDEDDELLNEAFRHHTAPPLKVTTNDLGTDDEDLDDPHYTRERHRADLSDYDEREELPETGDHRGQRKLSSSGIYRSELSHEHSDGHLKDMKADAHERSNSLTSSTRDQNDQSHASKKRKISETFMSNKLGVAEEAASVKQPSVLQNASKKRRIVTHNTVATYYTRLPQAFVQRADLRRLKHLMRQRRYREESAVWDLVMHNVSEQVEMSKRKLDMRHNEVDIWAAQYDGGARLLAKHEKLRIHNDALAVKLNREKVHEALDSKAKWTDALGKLVTATSGIDSGHKTFVEEQQTLSHVIHALSREVCRDFERIESRQAALHTLRQMAADALPSAGEKFDALTGDLSDQLWPIRMEFLKIVDQSMVIGTTNNTVANAVAEADSMRKFIMPTLNKKMRQQKLLSMLYADEPVIQHRIMQIEDESLAKSAQTPNLTSSLGRSVIDQMAKALSGLVPAPPKCLLYAVEDDREHLENGDENAGDSFSLPPAQFMDMLSKHEAEINRQQKFDTVDSMSDTSSAGDAQKTIGKFISDSLDADVVRLNSFVGKELAKIYSVLPSGSTVGATQ